MKCKRCKTLMNEHGYDATYDGLCPVCMQDKLTELTKEVTKELQELRQTFDLMLSRLEHADVVIQAARKLGTMKVKLSDDEHDAALLHLAIHVVAYDDQYPKPLNDPDAECCRVGTGEAAGGEDD